jgi:hypothetical protein
MNNELVSVIIKSIVAILSVVVTTVIVPYIKQRLGDDKYAELTNYVEWAVRSAEMLYTPEEWAEKKEYVMNYIIAKAGELKIELTENDINVLVEGIVHLVKKDKE